MIGIVTALPKEHAGMEAMLDNSQDYNVPGSRAGRRYRRGIGSGSSRRTSHCTAGPGRHGQ